MINTLLRRLISFFEEAGSRSEDDRRWLAKILFALLLIPALALWLLTMRLSAYSEEGKGFFGEAVAKSRTAIFRVSAGIGYIRDAFGLIRETP